MQIKINAPIENQSPSKKESPTKNYKNNMPIININRSSPEKNWKINKSLLFILKIKYLFLFYIHIWN